MVYTAKSTYEYITGDELEAFAIATYLSIDELFTEAAVMAQVTEAEKWVNEYCKQTFTAGAAPDGVKAAVKNLARYYMLLQILEKGYTEEMPFSLSEVLIICKGALINNVLGIDYSNSITDFDLRNRIG